MMPNEILVLKGDYCNLTVLYNPKFCVVLRKNIIKFTSVAAVRFLKVRICQLIKIVLY